MNRRCELSGAHSISVILVTPGIGIVVTANPAGTAAEWSLKAIPSTPRRLSILPGIIILTVLTQELQAGATSIGLTAANRDEADVVGYEYYVQRTDSLTPSMTWIPLTASPLSPAVMV